MFRGNLVNMIITLLIILVTIMLYINEIKEGPIRIHLDLTIEHPRPSGRSQPETTLRTTPRRHTGY